MFPSMQKNIEDLMVTASLKAEGRKQRTKLEEIFQDDVQDYRVLESELKSVMLKTKWIKKTPFASDPYFSIFPDNSVTYVTAGDCFDQIATILGWDETKRNKVLQKGTFRELLFSSKCPSTQVQTKEYTNNIIVSGEFGPVVELGFNGERFKTKPFLSHPIFHDNAQPEYITWLQMVSLFYAHDKFQSFQAETDHLFYRLQEAEFSKLPSKQKSSNKTIVQNKTITLEVPFITFIEKFRRTVCKFDAKKPENNHAFWATATGQEWSLQYDNLKNPPVTNDVLEVKADAEAVTPTPETLPVTPVPVMTISWAAVLLGILAVYPNEVESHESLMEKKASRLNPNQKPTNEFASDAVNDQSTATSMVEFLQRQYANVNLANITNAINSATPVVQLKSVLSDITSDLKSGLVNGLETAASMTDIPSTTQVPLPTPTTVEHQQVLDQMNSVDKMFSDMDRNLIPNMFEETRSVWPMMKAETVDAITRSNMPSLEIQRYLSMAARARPDAPRSYP